jgi:hypothetical protein
MPIPVAARSKAWVYGSSLAGTAGSNPAEAWMSVSCECCVLSGRGHCVGLINRPERSSTDCDCEAGIVRRSWPTRGCCAIGKKIRSSSFAVSAHTLQSPIHTSSSHSPVPSCQWPVDDCPTATHVFAHRRTVRMFVPIVRHVVLLRTGRKTETLDVPNRILWDTGTELFKTLTLSSQFISHIFTLLYNTE